MKELSLIEIQNALASAEREGADTDQPEGARFIRISETLALEIAFNLGRLHGEMLVMVDLVETAQKLAEGPQF